MRARGAVVCDDDADAGPAEDGRVAGSVYPHRDDRRNSEDYRPLSIRAGRTRAWPDGPARQRRRMRRPAPCPTLQRRPECLPLPPSGSTAATARHPAVPLALWPLLRHSYGPAPPPGCTVAPPRPLPPLGQSLCRQGSPLCLWDTPLLGFPTPPVAAHHPPVPLALWPLLSPSFATQPHPPRTVAPLAVLPRLGTSLCCRVHPLANWHRPSSQCTQ